MFKRAINLLTVLAFASCAALISGCGGSNNDQGMGFTLFGFYQDQGETGDSGRTVPLSTDPEAQLAVAGELTFYALQNNLFNQGVRVQRTILRYHIDGASLQPPGTTQPMGVVLGPAASSETEGGSTGTGSEGGGVVATPAGSLPPGWETIANVQYVQSLIVPPDILAWLNLNRQYLPELPFAMTVTASVIGITTAGNQLETNELNYIVQFVPDVIIPPTGGGSGGGSSSSAESE